MPRHVMLEDTVSAGRGVAADGQVPRLQFYAVEMRRRASPGVADADKVLIVVGTRVAGIVKRVYVTGGRGSKPPIPPVRDSVKAQACVRGFGDIRREIYPVNLISRQIVLLEVPSAGVVAPPVPRRREISVRTSRPVFRRLRGRRKPERKRECCQEHETTCLAPSPADSSNYLHFVSSCVFGLWFVDICDN